MKFLTLLSSTPEYMDFILPELKSMLRFFGIPLQQAFAFEFKQGQYPDSDYKLNKLLTKRYPFLYLNLPSRDIAKKICARTVLTVLMLDIFCEVKTYDELKEIGISGNLNHLFEDDQMKFKLYIDAFNANQGPDSTLSKIDQVTDWFQMKGSIDLKNPDRCFWIYQIHNFQMRSIDQTQSLEQLYFGEEIARNRVTANERRKDNHKFQLSNRVYLGPTSTDNNLSFLMANQGLVKEGDFVLDPFVGTGSLLIPPAHHGAVTFGCDIDPRVIQGLGVGRLNKQSSLYKENQKFVQEFVPQINLNFYQYGLPYPNIFQMDVTNNAFRDVEIFDCLICDPPYGWRASTRVVGVQHQSQEKQAKRAQQIANQQIEEKQIQESNKSNSENSNLSSKSSSETSPTTPIVQAGLGLDQIQLSETEILTQAKNNQQLPKQVQESKEKKVQQKEQKPKQKEELQEDQQDEEDGEGDNSGSDSVEYEKEHTPQQILVSVNHIVQNLFQIAEKSIKSGGHLVYLYPIQRQDSEGNLKVFTPDDFPQHDRFRLVDFSQHVLTKQKSRVLVTMQQIQ